MTITILLVVKMITHLQQATNIHIVKHALDSIFDQRDILLLQQRLNVLELHRQGRRQQGYCIVTSLQLVELLLLDVQPATTELIKLLIQDKTKPFGQVFSQTRRDGLFQSNLEGAISSPITNAHLHQSETIHALEWRE